MKKIYAAAVLCVLAVFLCTAAFAGQSYGPGHEDHQYACWDNGDGTHTVACDCGIDKRIEPHADADSDGVCDACGLVMEIPVTEPVIPEGWRPVWNKSGGVIFAVPADVFTWGLEPQEVEEGLMWRGSNADITVQLRVYKEDELTYDDFRAMLDEYEYEVSSVRNVSGAEVTIYTNPEPGANMQLCGAVLTGLDGRLYKISVFSGDNDDFSDDAAVWELSGMFMDTIHLRKFFGWDIYRQRFY